MPALNPVARTSPRSKESGAATDEGRLAPQEGTPAHGGSNAQIARFVASSDSSDATGVAPDRRLVIDVVNVTGVGGLAGESAGHRSGATERRAATFGVRLGFGGDPADALGRLRMPLRSRPWASTERRIRAHRDVASSAVDDPYNGRYGATTGWTFSYRCTTSTCASRSMTMSYEAGDADCPD